MLGFWIEENLINIIKYIYLIILNKIYSVDILNVLLKV